MFRPRSDPGHARCPPTRLLPDLVLFAAVLGCTVLVLGAVRGDGSPVPVAPDLAVPLRPGTSGTTAHAALARLVVLPSRPSPPGYERACGGRHRCVFGQPWTDAVQVPLGHNGIDTRTDIIDRDTSADGTLADPYSGRRTSRIQVDHVVPLAAAWDLGARDWTPARRRDFANDPLELLAVDAVENQVKSDLTPGDWRSCLRDAGRCRRRRPPTWTPRPGIRCAYAQRYVAICTTYQLPITEQDRASLSDMLATCPA